MNIVTFGEIMMRLATPGFQRFEQAGQLALTFGGGEANVAVSLANFGETARFISRVPDNDWGKSCLAALRAKQVDVSCVVQGGDRLGIYFLETGAAQRGSKIIYDRANSSFATINPGMVKWKDVFEGADWFHWTGITPAVSRSAAETCLEAVKTARQMGLTVSCDLNYRAKLWKWGATAGEVMEELTSHCQVVLGNEEDAEKVFGIKAHAVDVVSGKVEAEAYQGVCMKLREKFPRLETIAITLRGSKSASHNSWSGVLWQGDAFYQAPVYDIYPIVDRVGGGDAFMAGLIYGLRHYADDPQKAVNFAAASACLKHAIPGDFNRVSVAEVEQLMAGDASGRVAR